MVGTLENMKNKEIFAENVYWYENKDNSKALLHVVYSEAPSPCFLQMKGVKHSHLSHSGKIASLKSVWLPPGPELRAEIAEGSHFISRTWLHIKIWFLSTWRERWMNWSGLTFEWGLSAPARYFHNSCLLVNNQELIGTSLPARHAVLLPLYLWENPTQRFFIQRLIFISNWNWLQLCLPPHNWQRRVWAISLDRVSKYEMPGCVLK